jgi:hypothetical protein
MPATPADGHLGTAVPPRHRVKRALLTAAALLASVNIWTGAPLLAVWVGSHASGASGLSMTALWVVVGVLIVIEIALVYVLSLVTAAYDHLVQRPKNARRTSPWLRSLSGEREDAEAQRRNLGAMERVLVLAVVLGVLAFEAWFFFFSGSPIG